MGQFKNPKAPKFAGQKFIDAANKRNSKASGVPNTRIKQPKMFNKRKGG